MSGTDTTAKPHHTPDEKFRNPWPDSEPRGFSDMAKWILQRRTNPRVPSPPPNSFPVSVPEVVYPRTASNAFTATWIGHSTTLLQAGGVNILLDPVFSERASPLQWIGPKRVMPPALGLHALPPIDIILLSHSHYDHLDEASVRHIARHHPRAVWVMPLKLGAVVREWGVAVCLELDWWQSAIARNVRIVATPARHFSARALNDRNETLWCGFTIETGGKRAFFAGDSAYHPEFSRVGAVAGPFDLVMMPIGAYDPRWFMHAVHMDAEEAVQALVDVTSAHPVAATPMMLAVHWGTFRLTDEPMDEPPRRCSAAWAAHSLDPSRLWVARFGETRHW